MSKESNSGAKAAFKGFRTQTLYILERILNSNSQDVFYPEGAEDLLIKSETGEVQEVIQIKNYASNLALSNLEPEKDDSFFRRSLSDYYEEDIHPKIILVSFGVLGQELATLMTESKSPPIRKKLIAKKYSKDEVNWLFNHLSISTVNETNLTTLATKHLSNTLTGFSSTTAFDLLMYWLYLISEERGFVNREKLISKLQSIGFFFSKRKSFLIEFGTTIIPLESSDERDREQLADEFYQGISTRYEHIVEGFDVVRGKKIEELQKLFQNSNVVLIQGASGQGKSTLAYRFFHSYIPQNHSFRIQQSFSVSQIPKIQAALKLLVKEYDLPISILVDVPPNDFEKWTQLIKSLIEIDNLKLLVTIRAEDYNRSENIGEFIKVGDLLLDFSKSEAQDIYNALSKIKPDFKFTSFEEAWINFGESGSLLEFVYLISQGESLEIRLRNQIKKIKRRWTDDEIHILKVIAISHGYECGINTSSLKNISATSSLKSFIEELENEYFLRTSSDKKLLLGLHPIRSRIISSLLVDASFDDVEQIACDSLKIILEEDISKLLLNFFHENENPTKLLNELAIYKTSSWSAVGNILRALFWLGIKEFSVLNKDTIDEFRKEYHSILFLMIDDMGMGFDLSVLKKVNEERISKMEDLINQLSHKEVVYSHGEKWLTSFKVPSSLEMEDTDWSGIAYSLYWMDRLNIEREIDFSSIPPSTELNRLSINANANALLGFSCFNTQSKKIYNEYLPDFILRIKEEYKLVTLTEENEVVKTDFIYEIEDGKGEQTRLPVHETTSDILRLLRKAIPNKETYSIQGYGHKMNLVPNLHDVSTKNVPKNHLPISWRTEINGIFRQYIDYQNRPETWKDYTQTVIDVRRKSLDLLTSLINLLEQYFKKKNFSLLEPFFTDYKSEWYNKELDKPNQLPKIALDKWGYAKEREKKNIENSHDASTNIISQSKSQFLLGFGEYLKDTRNFFTSISNFYNQIDRVYLYNLYTHNKTGEDLKKTKITLQKNGYNPQMLRLSIINLFKAFQELPKFQTQFDKHFSKFYSSDFLDALNEEEKECYLKTSLIWKKFAQVNQSKKLKKKSKKVIVPSSSRIINDIENKLDNNLTKLCNGKKIETYDVVKFEDNKVEKTAILFDVNTPMDIYLKFHYVLKAIQESFTPANHISTKRLIIDQYYSPIIIVPLVYDKVVLPLYYEVPSFKFLDSNDELTLDSIGLYGKKIPNDMLHKLKVSLWETEIPNLKNAQNLLGNNTSILLYLNHLAQIEELIQKLDDNNEEGLELIVEHSKPKLQTIADLLMQNYNECNLISSDIPLTSTEMAGDIEKQEFAEIYMEFIQNLIDFGKLFNLDELNKKEGFTVTATITTEDIVKWNSIFQNEMQEPAIIIYLYWAGELIKKY